MPHFVFDITVVQSIRIVVAIWLTTVSLQSICSSVACADSPLPVDWARQFGGPDADFGDSLAVDATGNVFVTGSSFALSEPLSFTHYDFFISKYDRLGTLLWDKRIRSDQSDASHSVALDSAGNAYITGWISASTSTADNRDVLVTKYDTNGNELWSRTFGTTSDEFALDISVDADGNSIIGGLTAGNFGSVNAGSYDAYIAKVDKDGNLLWTKQFGTAGQDGIRSLTVDELGDIYVSGETVGKLGVTHFGSWDAYAAKLDREGSMLWTRQIGSSGPDSASAIIVDSERNSYIAGNTDSIFGGPFEGGAYDAFVAKLDADGVPVWIKELGTISYDRANAIALDGNNNVYVGGFAFGGDIKAALAKFSSDGVLVWTQEFGIRHAAEIEDIAIDSSDILHLVGRTFESDWAPNAGLHDAFVIKLSIPEPATALLLIIGSCGIAMRRRCPTAKRPQRGEHETGCGKLTVLRRHDEQVKLLQECCNQLKIQLG
jgi:hypothetical protein